MSSRPPSNENPHVGLSRLAIGMHRNKRPTDHIPESHELQMLSLLSNVERNKKKVNELTQSVENQALIIEQLLGRITELETDLSTLKQKALTVDPGYTGTAYTARSRLQQAPASAPRRYRSGGLHLLGGGEEPQYRSLPASRLDGDEKPQYRSCAAHSATGSGAAAY